jgi:hypothetical protein
MFHGDRLPVLLEVVSQPRLTPDGGVAGLPKCSHIAEYAPLPKTPRALPDGLMLVFQHPVTSRNDPLQILGTLGNLGTIGIARHV